MSQYTFGPRLTEDGAIFRLWAPAAKRVDVMLDTLHPMERDSEGWYLTEVKGVRAGAQYRFHIDGADNVPDPASAFQPTDIAGCSEVIDHDAYSWKAKDWRGRPWEETVLIETHVGSFTPEGTYLAMIDKLDHLVATGITAFELMPLADFVGRHNWGYDGVLWYAPDCMFGRPEDLKKLIDEAHLRGLMVFLDVVYNHFGPEGNYLGSYAPQFFGDAHTPWGSAIDYGVKEVSAFAVENAVYWLREYRFDGLRLDAVHAIPEQGEIPMLHVLSREVGKLAAETGRRLHVVLENDDNKAALLDPVTNPSRGKYRAQWNDDYHHAWHVLLTGEDKGYYSDYAPKAIDHVVRALASGFAYQGEPSPHRDGALRGEPSGKLPPSAFVNFLQNHDQIGNRALGDRLEALAKPKAIEAALTITLLAPMIPMLFQGDEWGSKAPFPFFCDFRGDLADAVRNGRKKEFSAAYAKYGDEIPDPLDQSTFRSAVLDWKDRDGADGQRRLKLVRELLAMRHKEIIPRLADARFGTAAADEGLLTAHWRMGDGKLLRLKANLSDDEITSELPPPGGVAIWGGSATGVVAPWSVHVHLGDE